MSVYDYESLASHAGHKLECVTYGGVNAAIECLDCGCVLVDFDAEDDEEMDSEEMAEMDGMFGEDEDE